MRRSALDLDDAKKSSTNSPNAVSCENRMNLAKRNILPSFMTRPSFRIFADRSAVMPLPTKISRIGGTDEMKSRNAHVRQ